MYMLLLRPSEQLCLCVEVRRLIHLLQFDSKAQVEEYVRDLPINSAFYLPAMYMQMMTHIFRPKPVRYSKILTTKSLPNTIG